uniref:Integrase core domain containing protein n=1 Tax=Solanum tuberosum TaxID=4113 RepID=M1DKQ1_SOLTU
MCAGKIWTQNCRIGTGNPSREAPRTVVSFTGNFMVRLDHLQDIEATGKWFTVHQDLYKPFSLSLTSGTTPPRRKNATPPSSPTTSQSEGVNASESNSSEFYVIYASTLMNIVEETETTKRAQKTLAATLSPLDTITIRGTIVNISEETIDMMLHCLEYTAPTSVFKGKYHAITSESEMEDPTSWERIMRWIAGYFATESEAVAWVSDPHMPITKASLTFSAKANIPPNKLVNKPVESSKKTATSKIQDVNNPFFGRKSGAVGPLAPTSGALSSPPASDSQATCTYITLPTTFLERFVVDQRQTRTLVDQIVHRMPQLIECDVFASKKSIKDEMWKDLADLKKMDGLEANVQTLLPTAKSGNNEEFKKQLAEMRD